MKLIIRITLALVMLCFACAEIKSPHSSNDLPKATATEIIQEATESNTETDRNLPTETVKQTEAETTSSKEAPIIERATEQEHASTAQSEVISEEITHAKTGGEGEIPSVIEHAKTGYDDEPEPTPQPVPEAEEPSDLKTAMDAACAYAVETYGVTIDTTLNFDNSSYRFPAVVPDTVLQETLNAKTIDMVEYTFQQQIALCGITVEDVRNAGIHCNVYCYRENGDILTYVFYDG